MKRSGPLVTLLGGLLLAVVMFTLNSTMGSGTSSAGGSQAPASTPPPTTPSAAPEEAESEPEADVPAPDASLPPDADYAGRVRDGSAAVAVSVQDGKALAYFSDGKKAESWLEGNVEEDGALRLTGKHGAKLEGAIGGDKADGIVTLDKESWQFSVAETEGSEGLYRAAGEKDGEEIIGSWIVLPDGEQVGVVTLDGKPGPAPKLDVDSGLATVEGEELTARSPTP